MAEPEKSDDRRPTAAELRRERLAEALRRNLRRRKEPIGDGDQPDKSGRDDAAADDAAG